MHVLQPHQRLAVIALSAAAPGYLARLMLHPKTPTPPAAPPPLPPAAEPVAFPSAERALCRGWWVEPQGPADTCVLLAHGWTSSASRLADWVEPLLGHGHRVLLYNARGHGNSDPVTICSLRQFTEDLVAAAAYARSRAGGGRLAVIGHSLGAAATLVALANGLPLEAAVTLAPPAHPRQATADLLAGQGLPAEYITDRVGRHVETLVGWTFDRMAPEVRVSEVTSPVLIAHGTEDTVVPMAHFHRIRRQAPANVELVLVPGADHDTIHELPEVRRQVLAYLDRVLGNA